MGYRGESFRAKQVLATCARTWTMGDNGLTVWPFPINSGSQPPDKQ